MKKIISLLASVAMLATMVTSVSAATLDGSEPVVSTTVVEMTADEYLEIAEVELEAGNTAYMVTATITGLDLAMVRAGSGTQAKKQRSGIGLAAAQYDIIWESEDNVVEVIAMDDGLAATADGTAITAAFLATKATEAYPEASNNTDTPEEADEAYLNAYVVVVSGDVTGTVESLLAIKSFEANSQTGVKNFGKADVAYEVNGVEGAVVTLAGPAQGGEEPAETEVVVGDKIDLEAGDVIGAAWNVTIKNFDSEKAYMAKFVDADTEEVRIGGEKAIDVSGYAETEGDLGFAVIMRLTTARNVALSIAIQ